jgi:hypothetical protein
MELRPEIERFTAHAGGAMMFEPAGLSPDMENVRMIRRSHQEASIEGAILSRVRRRLRGSATARRGRAAVKTGALAGAGAIALFVTDTQANINLELRPAATNAVVSTTFSVDLYAVSDNASSQLMYAAQVIITWDTAFVQFAGLDNSSTPLSSSFIGAEPYGLNTSTTDGDLMWVGFAPPLNPLPATPGGTLLTSFDFQALAVTGITPTLIDIAAMAGMSPSGNPGMTAVLDGTVPNLNVTGTLAGSLVTIVVPGPGGLALAAIALLSVGRRRRPQDSRGSTRRRSNDATTIDDGG